MLLVLSSFCIFDTYTNHCGCFCFLFFFCLLCVFFFFISFFFQAEDGIRDLVRSRGLGDVYKRQDADDHMNKAISHLEAELVKIRAGKANPQMLDSLVVDLSLIHI